MNKKIAKQIDAHQQRIIEIATARIMFLNEWIREHRNADYGTRYDHKLEQYRKEAEELEHIANGTTIATYEQEIYNKNLRIAELESLLRKCYKKMEGYGEFEVIQRMIGQAVNLLSTI